MNELNDVTFQALKVAAVVFGGVDQKSPEWQRCLDAAKIICSENKIPLTPMQEYSVEKARRAFDQCANFNTKFPIGTEGTVMMVGGVRKTTVDQPALTFPSQIYGEVVMAWFRDVGWLNVDFFSPIVKPLDPSGELLSLALQAKANSKPELAFALFQAVTRQSPENEHAWNEIGVHHQTRKEWDDAVRAYTMALKAKPDLGQALNNRGMAYRAIGRPVEALVDCLAAQKILPDSEIIGLNAASALDDMGQVDECLTILDARIARRSNDFNTRYNRSLVLLSAGRLKEGWEEFEARLHQPLVNTHYEHYDAPQWKGEDLAGRNILVWAEQGIGDEIMTASMIGELTDIAGSVTLLCTDRLVPLFKRSFPEIVVDHRPTANVVETYQRIRLRPEVMPAAARDGGFDFQMSQRDLGMCFRSDIKSFRSKERFLEPRSLKRPERNKVVGITWHSRGNARIGELKGMKLHDLMPVLRTPGITFVNLQYGDCFQEVDEARAEGIDILDCPVNPMEDLDGYASIVAGMDLVISASNTTAHLAGGLGVPCWVMVPTGPGRLWYWFREGDDCPWYPSLTLFRQIAATHWASVVKDVADKLSAWAS